MTSGSEQPHCSLSTAKHTKVQVHFVMTLFLIIRYYLLLQKCLESPEYLGGILNTQPRSYIELLSSKIPFMPTLHKSKVSRLPPSDNCMLKLVMTLFWWDAEIARKHMRARQCKFLAWKKKNVSEHFETNDADWAKVKLSLSKFIWQIQLTYSIKLK